MRANPLVSVLVDTRGEGREWKSVVVDGRYEELLDRIGHMPEREHAWSILSRHVDWWEPGALKPMDTSACGPLDTCILSDFDRARVGSRSERAYYLNIGRGTLAVLHRAIKTGSD